MANEENVITLDLGENAQLRFERKALPPKYGGGEGVDMRRMYRDKTGEWGFTKAGLFMSIDKTVTITTPDGEEEEVTVLEAIATVINGFLSELKMEE